MLNLKLLKESEETCGVKSIKLTCSCNLNMDSVCNEKHIISGYDVQSTYDESKNCFSKLVSRSEEARTFLKIYIYGTEYKNLVNGSTKEIFIEVTVDVVQLLVQHCEELVDGVFNIEEKLQLLINQILHTNTIEVSKMHVNELILFEDIELEYDTSLYLYTLSYIPINMCKNVLLEDGNKLRILKQNSEFADPNVQMKDTLASKLARFKRGRKLNPEVIAEFYCMHESKQNGIRSNSKTLRCEYIITGDNIANLSHLHDIELEIEKGLNHQGVKKISDIYTVDIEETIRNHIANRHLFKFKFLEINDLRYDHRFINADEFLSIIVQPIPQRKTTYLQLYQELCLKALNHNTITDGLVSSF